MENNHYKSQFLHTSEDGFIMMPYHRGMHLSHVLCSVEFEEHYVYKIRGRCHYLFKQHFGSLHKVME
mgnify:FL=1